MSRLLRTSCPACSWKHWVDEMTEVFLSSNLQRLSDWACLFIVNKMQTNTATKGEGRRATPNSLPTQQWQCNWLEGISLSLWTSHRSTTTQVIWTTWLLKIAYKEVPTQLVQGQRRETRLNLLLSPVWTMNRLGWGLSEPRVLSGVPLGTECATCLAGQAGRDPGMIFHSGHFKDYGANHFMECKIEGACLLILVNDDGDTKLKVTVGMGRANYIHC